MDAKTLNKRNKIRININSDKQIILIIIILLIAFYSAFSIKSFENVIYLISLCYYLIMIFPVLKTQVFSGLGMYVIYFLAFVQLGVLMQDLYFPLLKKTIYIITSYNFIAPITILFYKNYSFTSRSTLEKSNYQGVLLLAIFLIGLISILLYYHRVGTIPLFASDAENFRIQSLGGRGFLVILASTCFKISILCSNSFRFRVITTIIAVPLLLGTGFRSQALELILLLFIIHWIAKGRKYLLMSIFIFFIIFFLYALFGVIRQGISFKIQNLYMPVLWRLYVNTNNLNMIIARYPLGMLQYGKTFLIDLSVLLPGAQNNFITIIKDIINFRFDGGSLTPTIFGEGYYNWGFIGAIVWPIIILVLIMAFDNNNRKKLDINMYYILSFSLVGFSTTGFIPVLLNSYIPLYLVYCVLNHINKRYKFVY